MFPSSDLCLQLAAMSIEYTIDIQLTELGFPDILQPQDPSVTETACLSTSSDGSHSPSHSHTSPPNTHKDQSAVAAAAKQTSIIEENTNIYASPQPVALLCKPPDPSQSQDKQVVIGFAPPQPALLVIQQEGDGEEAQQDEESDSDDSDVSEVYEEEEADEEEEGPNDGMTCLF